VPRAQLTGLRVGFKPTPNLEIGLARVVQFGGYRRPGLFDTGVVDVLTGLNDSGEEDTENSLAAIDLRYRLRWPVRGELYLDWAGEDQNRMLGILPVFHDHGRLLGLYLPAPVQGLPLDLRLEWFKNDFSGDNPDVFYNHAIYRSGYTYRGKLLAHPFGSAAEGYSLHLDLYPTDHLDLGIEIDWLENRPAGAPEAERDLRLGCEALLMGDGPLRCTLRYAFERRTDVDGVAGEEEDSHRIGLGLVLDL
jgi:hypothetical protein